MSLDLPCNIREEIKQIPSYCKVVDVQSDIFPGKYGAQFLLIPIVKFLIRNALSKLLVGTRAFVYPPSQQRTTGHRELVRRHYNFPVERLH